MVKKGKIIAILICFFIALIPSLYFENAFIFFTIFFIELWIGFTYIFLKKRKRINEFNSPPNTPFFIFGPLFVSVFYSYWGYFATTGFLENNVLINQIVYLSTWHIIFAFPYFLYGLNILNSCFRKFNVVYIYKSRAVKARNFGYFLSFFILVIIILIYFIVPAYWYLFPALPTPFTLDLIILLMIICTVLMLGINIATRKKYAQPRISQDLIAQRRRSVDRITSTPVRSRPQRQRPRPTTTTTRPTTQRQSSSRSRPQGQRRTQTNPTPTRTRPTKTKSSTGQKQRSKINFEKYKPKAGVIALEDFKCIFCFQLPSLPKDEGRGIVICPQCKHPAHADEFRDWTRSSTLCSRCDANISPSFIRNPRIISVRNYLRIINHYTKGKR